MSGRNASGSGSNQASSSKPPASSLRRDNNNQLSKERKPLNNNKNRNAIESDEASDDDSSDDDDDSPLPKFEKVQEQYLNQVIDKAMGADKLKGMSNEMSILRKGLKQFSDALSEAAADLATNKADPEGEVIDMDNLPEDLPLIKKLDAQMRKVLEKIMELDIRLPIINEMRQQLLQGKECRNFGSIYRNLCTAPLLELSQKTSRQKFLENKAYIEFRNSIWENLHNGNPVPNIKRMLPLEPNDDEESDDEIEIGAATTDFKCALTMGYLKDAMTSTKCPHSFSAASLKEYFRPGGALDCPTQGCSQKLTAADFESNPALQRRVEAHLKREKDGTNQRPATQFHEVFDSDDDD